MMPHRTQHTLHQNRFRNEMYRIRPEINVSAFRRCDEFSLYKLYIVLQSPVAAGRSPVTVKRNPTGRQRAREREIEKSYGKVCDAFMRKPLTIYQTSRNAYVLVHCDAKTNMNMNAFEYFHAVPSIKVSRIHVVCVTRCLLRFI